jgi:hypothetical protein
MEEELVPLTMEAACTSETSVNFYQTTRRSIPEDSHLHSHRRENLKSRLCIRHRENRKSYISE